MRGRAYFFHSPSRSTNKPEASPTSPDRTIASKSAQRAAILEAPMFKRLPLRITAEPIRAVSGPSSPLAQVTVFVDLAGIEPATSSMPGKGALAERRLVDPAGIEPATSAMPWRRSTK